MALEFDQPPPAAAGQPVALDPDLRRVLAPNASPMTYWGTNTYLLGQKSLAVIDPGPNDPDHLAALREAIGTTPVEAILVTHAHLDHSPLARPLAEATGAPVLAFGDALAGRSAIMEELARSGDIGGGEGVDADFRPDRSLCDGEILRGTDWQVEALHTPGHFGNHLSFEAQGRLFTGDLVMGWASSLVSPPDGDLTDFMASCRRLRGRDARQYHPGHGAPLADGPARLDWLIAHRETRESQILGALAEGPATAAALAAAIYTDTPAVLLPAATRNVLAHLLDLLGRSVVTHAGALSENSVFSKA